MSPGPALRKAHLNGAVAAWDSVATDPLRIPASGVEGAPPPADSESLPWAA